MKKTLLLIQSVAILTLLWTSTSFSQTSVNEKTGLWTVNSTWIGNNAPGTVDLQNTTVTVGGRVTRDGNLSFKNNANLFVDNSTDNTDTLIVTGDLIFKGNTNLTIRGNGILIVLGNLTSQNNINIVSSGKLVVVGSASTGNNTNITNSGAFYIFEDNALGTGGGSNYNGTQPGNADSLAANDQALADYLVNVLGVTNAALPIELKSFTAKLNNNSIQLDWVTAKEENFSHFEVERSLDMENFEMIGLVQGQGESLSDVYYDLNDSDALFGVIYYRLKAVDIDDTFEYSPVVKIENGFNGQVSVYPNPAVQKGYVKIQLPSSFKGDINHIALYDLQGSKMQEFFSFDPTTGIEY